MEDTKWVINGNEALLSLTYAAEHHKGQQRY